MPARSPKSTSRVLVPATALALVCAGWQPIGLASAAASKSPFHPAIPKLGHPTPGTDQAPISATAVDRSSQAVPARNLPAPGHYSLSKLDTQQWQSIAGGQVAVRTAEPAHSASVASQVSAASVSVLSPAEAASAHAAGIAFALTRADHVPGSASIQIKVADGALAGLYGADFASRLHWVERPVSGGESVPLATRRSGSSQIMTATTSATPMLVMATSGPTASNGTGNFAATSLKPASTWDVSAQTGTFSWSYPMDGVPAAAGPQPALALSYSSQSVDGETGSTNNQPSAIGDGWDLAGAGFIERSYASCSDDGQSGSGDLCWQNQNATLSMAGHSGRLVQIGTSKIWRLQDDDGSRVEQLTGAVNGLQDGEYWRVTTPDGTEYYFGRNEIPGWQTGNPVTNSAWGVPVAGNNTGEPCNKTTFATSFCAAEGWRWNLDYVVDPHGNSEVLRYTAETNQYRENNTTTVNYTRGGQLSEIDYGTRAGSEFSATSSVAPARMLLDYASRCTGTCGATDTAAWPDTPLDQKCPGASGCASNVVPTFFTTLMLSKVHAQSASGSTFADVDTWALSHSFPDPGDTNSAALWLDSVQRTAAGSTAITLPAVKFSKTPLHNRVDINDGLSLTVKYRISMITTETGALINVGYSTQQCTKTTIDSIKANPAANSYRCFPQWWTPQTTPPTDPFLDWFHSYVVTSVSSDPATGGPKDQVDQMYYDYTGSPAWRWDDSPTTPDSKRTWSVYAGYDKVRVSHGNHDDLASRTSTDYLFFQGKDGDHNVTGPVYVTASDGSQVRDSLWLAGRVRETIHTLGVAGAMIDDSFSTPWVSDPTATDALYTARYVRDGDTLTNTALSDGGNRTTETTISYDTSSGLPTTVDDQADIHLSSDDRCTTTTYDGNQTAWLRDYPAEVSVVAGRCNAQHTYPADAISDTRYSYDNAALGVAPTKGDVTKTEQVSSYGVDQSPNWQTLSTTTYDALGRLISTTDPRISPARTTTTTYTPSGAGLVTTIKVTDPMNFSTTDTYAVARHSLLTETTANTGVTESTYDALGRITAVWTPDHTRTANPSTATVAYGYTISQTAASSVKTTRLVAGGSLVTSYTMYDGLLRARQTQTPAEGGGRDLTDTFYDAAGRVYDTYTDWYDTAVPAGMIFNANLTVPSETQTTYDGDGRKTADILLGDGQQLWYTSYAYGGDHTTVTPPAGGIATSTYTDARGNTSKLLSFHGSTPTGASDLTSYAYWPAGQLKSMTDSSSNQWTWTYDVLGRLTDSHDPDQGDIHHDYDAAGRLTDTKDARNIQLDYSYDAIDRKTDEYLDPASPANKLAHWDYDTAAVTGFSGATAKGQLADSIRYVGGSGTGGKAFTTTVTSYDPADRITGTKVSIPAGYGALSADYTASMAWAPDGQQTSQGEVVGGGLGTETLTIGHDTLGQPGGLRSSLALYVSSVQYDHYGRLAQLSQSWSATSTYHTPTWQDGSDRLLEMLSQRQAASGAVVSDRKYTYNDAGDITEINDPTPATGTDTQCFDYDYDRQLQDAWTPSSNDCGTARQDNALGGPAPYWQSYSYDSLGDRATVTRHDTTGTGTDVTDSYTYPASGADSVQPHAVSTITHSDGSAASTYGYDQVGNANARPGQTLNYDAEGHLQNITVGSYSANDIYDADGNLLLQADNAGTTLYLGDTQLRLATGASSASAVRDYTAPNGSLVAERTTTAGVTGSKLYFLDTDKNGTVTATIDTSTNTPVRRYFDPFGSSRGNAAAWIDPNTYLNEPLNGTTGTVHVGAREYDPTLGRFLSVDAVLDTTNPLQDNGYSYSLNNPVSTSDPTGLHTDGAQYGDTNRSEYYNPDVPTDIPDPPGAGSSASGSSAPKKHRSWIKNYLAGAVAPAQSYVSSIFQMGAGMQDAQNIQHGVPTDLGPAAQAATDDVFDCTQTFVCLAGGASAGLLEGGVASGLAAAGQRGSLLAGNTLVEEITGVATDTTAPRVLTTSEQRALRSLQSQVEAHTAKLNDYMANPDAYDNQGLLARAPSPQIRQRIIDGRIRHLQTEIKTFQDQITKIQGGG